MGRDKRRREGGAVHEFYSSSRAQKLRSQDPGPCAFLSTTLAGVGKSPKPPAPQPHLLEKGDVISTHSWSCTENGKKCPYCFLHCACTRERSAHISGYCRLPWGSWFTQGGAPQCQWRWGSDLLFARALGAAWCFWMSKTAESLARHKKLKCATSSPHSQCSTNVRSPLCPRPVGAPCPERKTLPGPLTAVTSYF